MYMQCMMKKLGTLLAVRACAHNNARLVRGRVLGAVHREGQVVVMATTAHCTGVPKPVITCESPQMFATVV